MVPHQDSAFLYTDQPSCIGLWIALEDANKENGCLWHASAAAARATTAFVQLRAAQRLGCLVGRAHDTLSSAVASAAGRFRGLARVTGSLRRGG